MPQVNQFQSNRAGSFADVAIAEGSTGIDQLIAEKRRQEVKNANQINIARQAMQMMKSKGWDLKDSEVRIDEDGALHMNKDMQDFHKQQSMLVEDLSKQAEDETILTGESDTTGAVGEHINRVEADSKATDARFALEAAEKSAKLTTEGAKAYEQLLAAQTKARKEYDGSLLEMHDALQKGNITNSAKFGALSDEQKKGLQEAIDKKKSEDPNASFSPKDIEDVLVKKGVEVPFDPNSVAAGSGKTDSSIQSGVKAGAGYGYKISYDDKEGKAKGEVERSTVNIYKAEVIDPVKQPLESLQFLSGIFQAGVQSTPGAAAVTNPYQEKIDAKAKVLEALSKRTTVTAQDTEAVLELTSGGKKRTAEEKVDAKADNSMKIVNNVHSPGSGDNTKQKFIALSPWATGTASGLGAAVNIAIDETTNTATVPANSPMSFNDPRQFFSDILKNEGYINPSDLAQLRTNVFNAFNGVIKEGSNSVQLSQAFRNKVKEFIDYQVKVKKNENFPVEQYNKFLNAKWESVPNRGFNVYFDTDTNFWSAAGVKNKHKATSKKTEKTESTSLDKSDS